MEQIIKKICTKRSVLGVFVGGSRSRGFCDQHSDIDYGVIVEDKSLEAKLEREFSIHFGKLHEEVEKEFSRALHFMGESGRFEIRLVRLSSIVKTLEKLDSGEILSYSEQDLLENIRRGNYLSKSSGMDLIIGKIKYTEALKRQIIGKYLPLLDHEEVRIPTLRKDRFLMMHYLVDIQRAGMVLAHAQVKQFTTSFKHEQKLFQTFSETAQEFFQSLNEMYCNPGEKTFEDFTKKLNKFREELYHGIHNKNE